MHPKFVGNNLIFATGNFIKVANALESRLRELSPDLKELKTYKAVSNGSLIYSPKGELIRVVPLDKAEAHKLCNWLFQIQPDCYLVLSTRETNLVVLEHTPEKLENFAEIKAYNDSKGEMGIDFELAPDDLETTLQKIDELLGIYVLTVGDPYSLTEAVLGFMAEHKMKNNFMINNSLMQFTASSKWEALQFITEFERKHQHSANFARAPEDIIFFGDDTNDLECLKKCKLSFGRGKKLSEEVIKASKFQVDDLTEVAEKLLEE